VEVELRGLGVSVGIMVLFSLALLLFFARGRRLSRGEGVFLVIAYLTYIGYLATEGST
jgi:Ca2+/Na+ antiporter